MTPAILRTLGDILHLGKRFSIEQRIEMADQLIHASKTITYGETPAEIRRNFAKNTEYYRRILRVYDPFFRQNLFIFSNDKLLDKRTHFDKIRGLRREFTGVMSQTEYGDLLEVHDGSFMDGGLGFSVWFERVIFLDEFDELKDDVAEILRNASLEVARMLESPEVGCSRENLSMIAEAVYG